jgi:Holliday junction resolvase RusA-like endonuclease
VIALVFPVPHEPRSVNKMPSSRGGRIGLSKERAKWRDTAEAYAADYPDLMAGLGPSTVQVSIPFSNERRRDPHNYTGTVVKWIIDGLVRAGVWADDNPKYVTVLDPVLVIGNEVTVTIRPREAP